MECRALGCLSLDYTMVFCVQRALHTIYLSFSWVIFLLSVCLSGSWLDGLWDGDGFRGV
jgi:hypothetical protein